MYHSSKLSKYTRQKMKYENMQLENNMIITLQSLVDDDYGTKIMLSFTDAKLLKFQSVHWES